MFGVVAGDGWAIKCENVVPVESPVVENGCWFVILDCLGGFGVGKNKGNNAALLFGNLVYMR